MLTDSTGNTKKYNTTSNIIQRPSARATAIVISTFRLIIVSTIGAVFAVAVAVITAITLIILIRYFSAVVSFELGFPV